MSESVREAYLAVRAAESSDGSSTFPSFYLRFIKSQPSMPLTFTEQEKAQRLDAFCPRKQRPKEDKRLKPSEVRR